MVFLAGTTILTLLLSCVHTLHLPKYITACSRSDPKFNDCALKNLNKAFPIVVKGDNKYKVMSVDPARISKIEIEAGPNLQLTFSDLVCSGIPDLKVKYMDFNLTTEHVHVDAFVPHLYITGNYILKGKILSLPIGGEGKANVTFGPGEYTYDFDWKSIQKNGVEYIEIVNPVVKFDLKTAHFQFDNLFNGDKTLGDQMNKFINENWSEVMKEVGGGIAKTLSTILTSLVKGYIEAVPFNEVVLP